MSSSSNSNSNSNSKKKKESEGIALLSMYYDEEEEEEDDDMDDIIPEDEDEEKQNEQENIMEQNNNITISSGIDPPFDNSAPPPPPPVSAIDNSETHSEAMKYDITQTPEEAEAVEVNENEIDHLDKFLPPPPNTQCSDELQDKIIKFLLLKKKTGRSFNSEVRNRKEYRNPDFLLHAVTYQDIDQIGSCFSKDVFDPHGYDKSDYYDEIEADLKRELERKEQEKKKNQKIDFLSGGTQPAIVIPTPKVTPIPPVPPVSASVDVGTREGRPNKKSKWDKVDGDTRHPLTTGGQDPVSAVNAGSGYTAFAQQRRKEAEERRSSDRKLDRRS